MAVVRIIACYILWLGLVPLCAGVIPVYFFGKKPRNFGTTFLLGWVLMLSIFELLAVPFIVEGRSLTDLSKTFMIVMLITSLAGVIITIIGLGKCAVNECYEMPRLKEIGKSGWMTWLIFALILLVQLIMSIIYMTPDGDDSYYITQAVIADVKDVMMREEAYTGVVGALKLRYFLSPFPMFIAFLARRSGVHAVIVAHTVLPLVLIPLTYLVYYKIGSCFFNKHKDKVAVFMVIISGIQIFGAASFYTNETFFMTRTWQGKSVLANVIIPLVFYMLLLICRATEAKKEVNVELSGVILALLLVNMAGMLLSSMWMFLMPVYEGTLMLVIAIRNKKPKLVPALLIAVLPCYSYLLIYGTKFM